MEFINFPFLQPTHDISFMCENIGSPLIFTQQEILNSIFVSHILLKITSRKLK